MSYLPLARRYRPQTFDEIIGQEYVSKTLKNAVSEDRVASGYLFCGPRGTAKTSTARILAKAMNCTEKDGPNPEPCGICEACVQIAESKFIDVQEIDAASGGKIDDIRDLIAGISFPAMEGRYKIYIIDEAHQLSKDAKDAILKTLEEPPPSVIFILATTEAAKIPSTIASRCQSFDFLPGTEVQIMDLLKDIAEKEGVEIEEAGLKTVSSYAQGSYRDGLSLLDQCIAYAGKKITTQDVIKSLRIPEDSVIDRTIEAIAKGDKEEAFNIALLLLKQGISGLGFATRLLDRIRDLTFTKITGKNSDKKIVEQSKSLTLDQLLRVLRSFYFLKDRLIFGGYERVEVEMGLLNLIDSASSEVNPYVMEVPRGIGKLESEVATKQVEMAAKDLKATNRMRYAIDSIMGIAFDFPGYFPPATASKVITDYFTKTKDTEIEEKSWVLGLRRAALDKVRSLCNSCEKCSLHKNRIPERGSTFGEGPVDALVMIVAEGPGEYEQRTGLPLCDGAAIRVSTCATKCHNFESCYTVNDKSDGDWARTPCGPCKFTPEEVEADKLEKRLASRKKDLHTAGSILSKCMIEAGLTRGTRYLLISRLRAMGRDLEKADIPNVYLTNSVRCRSVDSNGKNAAPTQEEIDTCRPWLQITERLVNPKAIIGLGKIGLQGLETELGKDFSITKACPTDLSVPAKALPRKNGGKAYVCFHPAYIMHRNDEKEGELLEKKLTAVLKEVKQIAESEPKDD